MGIQIKGGGEPSSDINVAPLIDIVLVMLIIFMVAVPIKIDEMAVNLPKDTQLVEPEEMPEDQLVVGLYDDGTVALNRHPMSVQEIGEELAHRLKFKRRRVVFVDAHPDLLYHDVVSVMDIVRDAGAERVALARMKPEGPAAPISPEEAEGATGEEGAP